MIRKQVAVIILFFSYKLVHSIIDGGCLGGKDGNSLYHLFVGRDTGTSDVGVASEGVNVTVFCPGRAEP